MPYIEQNARLDAHQGLKLEGTDFVPLNAGEFNFIISSFIENYIARNGKKYAVVNEMMGALECAKQELYRVVIGPYEDEKISQNGAVYLQTRDGSEY